MRRIVLAALLAASASIAIAAPTPKEQLMTPPAGARHYTISSTAGKHGDIWSWTTPDGKIAYRMSMSLRGWITEDDELITRRGRTAGTSIAIRGFTDSGDATEDFNVDGNGVAHWKTAVDSRLRSLRRKALQHATAVRGWRASRTSRRWSRPVTRASTCCPTAMPASASGSRCRSTVPQGPKTVKLAFIKGLGFSADPGLARQRQPLFRLRRDHLAASRRL